MTVIHFEVSDEGDWINVVVLGNAIFQGVYGVLVMDFVDDGVAKELFGNNVGVINVSAGAVVVMGLCNDSCCGLRWNDCCGSTRINGWNKGRSLIDWC